MKMLRSKLTILLAVMLAAVPVAVQAELNHWNWPGYEGAVTLPADVPGDVPWTNLPGEVPGDVPWTNLPGEVPGDVPWTNLPGQVVPPYPPAPPIAIQPIRPIPPGPTVIRFVIGSPVYQVHGENIRDSEGLAPFIDTEAGRTMIPLRLAGEILGAQVTWVEATETVIIELDGRRMTMQIGVPLPYGMGMPIVRQSRTFVPVNYVAQFFGATARWDEAAQAVYITR